MSGTVTDTFLPIVCTPTVSLIGADIFYTIVLRHRDCDPEGWSKCKACTCPDPPSPPDAVNVAVKTI